MKKQFDIARDDKNYQRWQLWKKSSREAMERIDALKDQEEKDVNNEFENQFLNRDADLILEKEKLKEEAIRQSKLPPYQRTERYTEDRIRELAERNLEVNNKEKISAIQKDFERRADKELAKAGLWIGPAQPQQSRDTDALTRFHARNEQDLGDRDNENER
jgi:hypothetical protein